MHKSASILIFLCLEETSLMREEYDTHKTLYWEVYIHWNVKKPSC